VGFRVPAGRHDNSPALQCRGITLDFLLSPGGTAETLEISAVPPGLSRKMLLSRHSKCRAIIMLPLTGRGQHSHHVMKSGEAEPNAFLDDEDAISLVGWMLLRTYLVPHYRVIHIV
jgi:hypothetical protein